MLSPHRAATLLGISRRTLDRLVKDGRIPAVRIGGNWRIDPDVIDAVRKHGTRAN